VNIFHDDIVSHFSDYDILKSVAKHLKALSRADAATVEPLVLAAAVTTATFAKANESASQHAPSPRYQFSSLPAAPPKRQPPVFDLRNRALVVRPKQESGSSQKKQKA
jgi:hypothetical protein